MRNNNNTSKISYHLDHARRFQYTLQQIKQLVPTGGLIADIGCHRLDFGLMLRESGYQVVGFDVPEFIAKDSVKNRAINAGIRLVTIADLGKAEFSEEFPEDTFDAIVFAEILEHITFNPLDMWLRLFGMIREDGHLFVTTPNSMSLRGTLRGIWNIVSRTGYGLPFREIFSNVTYGHHWKEYSRKEVLEYFCYLGVPKKNISVEYVSYRKKEKTIRSLVISLIECLTPLKPGLFCTLKISNPKLSVPSAPVYLG